MTASRGQPNKEEAINRVIDLYLDALFRVAFLHTKNRPDAEDVVQDVLLKLLRKMPTFASEAHEKAWLLKVVTNQSRDFLRSAWRRRFRPLAEARLDQADPPENEVLSRLLELPPKYSQVLLLFYYEGYCISEIANITGQKETTVGSQLHRARNMLKPLLEEDGDEGF